MVHNCVCTVDPARTSTLAHTQPTSLLESIARSVEPTCRLFHSRQSFVAPTTDGYARIRSPTSSLTTTGVKAAVVWSRRCSRVLGCVCGFILLDLLGSMTPKADDKEESNNGDEPGDKSTTTPKKTQTYQERCFVYILFALLVVVGVVNFVMMKVLYVAFKSNDVMPMMNGTSTAGGNASTMDSAGPGSGNNTTTNGARYSFFVNQSINFFHIVIGAIIVYPRMLCTNDITPAMRKTPQRIFVFMALLDSFGTFFISMGSVYTPGQIQPLLNQALIPMTMGFSCVWLRSR